MECIQGLSYVQNFLSAELESKLLSYIDSREWDTTISRRTQHYGYKYSYGPGATVTLAEEIPDFLKEALAEAGYRIPYNQVIINEYMPGQGIAAHTDHKSLFGDTIASISMGSDAIMNFIKDGVTIPVTLHRGSCVVLRGDARSGWKHEIPARKSDNGVPRGRRVSITLRTVK